MEKNYKMRSKKIILIFLCFTSFFLFQGVISQEVPGEENTSHNISSEEFFSRPLRSLRVIRSDHPDFRNVLPSHYNNGTEKGNIPTLLCPQGLEQALTLYYIQRYSNPSGIRWLRSSMERGAPYLAFIQQEIAERNLPEELIFLPVIESEFVISAVSRSGAAGLWQFMANSIAPFDMVINDWMDERRDFWKSTQGALRKLEENYAFFGDWPLALAAYNAGLGAVSRAVNNSGINDYWVLSQRNLLPRETIHYVPRLLAAAYILSNPRQFDLILWPENPDWTRIAVNRTVDLNLLALEAGIEAGILRIANRELTYNITPPDREYLLKVRNQDAEKVNLALAGGLPLVNYYIHTLRSGDTLSALALYYGITVDQITAVNPGIQARYLRIGTNLMIPAFRDLPVSEPNPEGLLDFSENYLVKQGDTLWAIALAYGISPETLAEANGMRINDILREGRVLRTPIKE